MSRYSWLLITAVVCLIYGAARYFKAIETISGLWQRMKLINFAENEVNSAIIVGDIGRGKTLLMSILTRGIKNGIKKAGFVSNIKDAEILSYSDINIHEPKYERDTYNIPKFFFLDEGNLYIKGNDFRNNRIYHKGVSLFLAWSRHLKVRLWMTAQRPGQVWVEMRDIVNYYVKLGPWKKLWNYGENSAWIMPVEFYTQSGELYKEFNTFIMNQDFELYDSYWLKDIRHFFQIKDKPVHNAWVNKY